MTDSLEDPIMKKIDCNDCRKPKFYRFGFTLIELLVVISIIALLLSILMPSLSKAKELSRNVVCQSNLRQQGLGSSYYVQDNDNHLPAYLGLMSEGSVTWAQTLAPYLAGRGKFEEGTYEENDNAEKNSVLRIFECPSQRDKFQFNVCLRYGINPINGSYYDWLSPEITYHPLDITKVRRLSERLQIADSMDSQSKYLDMRYITRGYVPGVDEPVGYMIKGKGTTLGSNPDHPVSDRHSKKSNVLFMDGHLSSMDYWDIMFRDGITSDRTDTDEEYKKKNTMWDYRIN